MKCHQIVKLKGAKGAIRTLADLEHVLPKPWEIQKQRHAGRSSSEPPISVMCVVPDNEPRGCDELKALLAKALDDSNFPGLDEDEP